MSRLASLLALPPEVELPQALSRAWDWAEDQGWGSECDGRWRLAPDTAPDHAMVFSSDLRLAEIWRTGADRLAPIALLTADGDLGALWRDDQAGLQFVAIGADGDTVTLAETPVDLLRLVAMDWPDAFGRWVTAEFGVEIPREWSAGDSDAFTDWAAAVHNGETPPYESARGTVRSAPVTPDGPEPTTVIEVAESLLGEPGTDTIVDQVRDTVAVTSLPHGHLIGLVHTDDFAADLDGTAFEAAWAEVGPALAAREDAAVERWGTPSVFVAGSGAQPPDLAGLVALFGHREAAQWHRADGTITMISGQGDEDGPIVQLLFITPAPDFDPGEQILTRLRAHPTTHWHDRLATVATTTHRHVDGTVRHGLTDGSGAVAVWWFTPDGRVLGVLNDPHSPVAAQDRAHPLDHQQQLARYDGVPADLITLARNRPDLPDAVVDGAETIQRATAVVVCDGDWQIAEGTLRSLAELGTALPDSGLPQWIARITDPS